MGLGSAMRPLNPTGPAPFAAGGMAEARPGAGSGAEEGAAPPEPPPLRPSSRSSTSPIQNPVSIVRMASLHPVHRAELALEVTHQGVGAQRLARDHLAQVRRAVPPPVGVDVGVQPALEALE